LKIVKEGFSNHQGYCAALDRVNNLSSNKNMNWKIFCRHSDQPLITMQLHKKYNDQYDQLNY